MEFGTPEAHVNDDVETKMEDLVDNDVECDDAVGLDEMVQGLDDEWDRQLNRYFLEASNDLQRQIDQDLDDAIQKELDEQMDEQIIAYFQQQQQIEDDKAISVDLGRILGFTAQRHVPPVTVADVEASIQQVVQSYMAKAQLRQFH